MLKEIGFGVLFFGVIIVISTTALVSIGRRIEFFGKIEEIEQLQ